jgi:hypothetical protein
MDASQYARVSQHGHAITVRTSVHTPWDDAHAWPLGEAQELAEYLPKLVRKAMHDLPEVRELTKAIGEIDTDAPVLVWEDLAYALVQRGYHK